MAKYRYIPLASDIPTLSNTLLAHPGTHHCAIHQTCRGIADRIVFRKTTPTDDLHDTSDPGGATDDFYSAFPLADLGPIEWHPFGPFASPSHHQVLLTGQWWFCLDLFTSSTELL